MPGFFILAIFALVAGVIAMATGADNWRRRQRILKTPTTPIAHAHGAGFVEIKGRIVPGEQGVFTTPFSGRPAVFCRIRVQERRRRGKSTYWHTVVEEIEARDFYVDDGSGQHARIAVRTAETILDRQSVASSGTFSDPPPHLAAFLASRGVASTTWIGFNKSMQYLEEVLAPGDALFALGPSHHEAGPPVQDGYRMVPARRLVMAGMGRGDLELILSNKSEQDLTQHLGTGMFVGIGLVATSVVLGIVGVILGLSS